MQEWMKKAGPVVLVDSAGCAMVSRLHPGMVQERKAAEVRRFEAIKAAAVPPERVSPEIIPAPARRYSVAETPRETVMTPNGPRIVRSAPVGFDRVRCGDAFDRMHDQARRRHAAIVAEYKKANRAAPDFLPPITPGQEAAGRDYAALAERVAASGVKCSSVEALGVTGGGGDREVAMLRDFDRLRALQRRIGDGLAKDVCRPSKGGMRHAIRVRVLVDQVCLGAMTLDEIMRAHGWAPDRRIRLVLQAALAAALDRMQGYDLARPQNLP